MNKVENTVFGGRLEWAKQLLAGLPEAWQQAEFVGDSRVLKAGDVLVWDDRNKPGLAARLFDEAREKNAAGVICNMPGDGVMLAENPGEYLAAWARVRFPNQPKIMLGVTGTSGKTSTAWFVQQLARLAGEIMGRKDLANSASIGTFGLVRRDVVEEYYGFTSPTALTLHPILQKIADNGVHTAVMEVSSHALDLRRAEGVDFTAAAITNITQDHLDYHGSLEAYHAAKMRLFSEVLPESGTAVLNMGRPECWPAASIFKQRGGRVLTAGKANAELVVAVEKADGKGLDLTLKYDANPVAVHVPLLGAFQAENLALALGLLVAAGYDWKALTQAVAQLTGVPGRMELVPHKDAALPAVVVDYAHKPDALQRALESVVPLVDRRAGGKVWCVFGCGGNRDALKRPMMGRISATLADVTVVTDDNPRFEDAASVRDMVMAGAHEVTGAVVHNMGDRHAAISFALENAGPNDIVLIAGKGDEHGQIVGDKVLPFDDRVVVKEIWGI